MKKLVLVPTILFALAFAPGLAGFVTDTTIAGTTSPTAIGRFQRSSLNDSIDFFSSSRFRRGLRYPRRLSISRNPS